MRPGELFDVLIRTFALAMIGGAIAALFAPAAGPFASLAIGILFLIFAGQLARLFYGRT